MPINCGTRVVGLDQEALTDLLIMLQQVAIWPQQQPGLARAVLVRAGDIGGDAISKAVGHLTAGMGLSSYGWANGVSDELQRARDLTAARAGDEAHDQLRVLLIEAHARLVAQVANLRREEGDDE